MLSLLFVGVRLEEEFGFVKIGTLYMLSGFGGSLMSCLSLKIKLSVGSSGALFGLLGSMLSELFTNWTIYAGKCAALLALIVVIAINLAIGMLPHVDSSEHMGGFISGFFLGFGFILLIHPQYVWISCRHIPTGYDMQLIKPKYKVYQLLLGFLALVMLIIWFLNCLVKLLVIPRKKMLNRQFDISLLQLSTPCKYITRVYQECGEIGSESMHFSICPLRGDVRMHSICMLVSIASLNDVKAAQPSSTC